MFEKLSKKEQLLFIAGLFEGEGWFGINRRKNNWKSTAVLEVQMTDLDCIQKFQKYLEIDTNVFKRNYKQKEHYKDVYRFVIKGYRALHLMEEMLPYLGIRRKEQYYNVVKSIGDGPKNWSPPIREQTEDQTSNV